MASYFEPFRKEILGIVSSFETRIIRTNSTLDEMFSSLNDEIFKCIQMQKKDYTLVKVSIDKIILDVTHLNELSATHESSFTSIIKTLIHLNECFKIQQILNISDEQDRQAIGL